MAYLLAWNPDVDVQDKEGSTALHLAVRSVEELESTRPIRALLMKGANPDIKDKEGLLAIDHVDAFSNDAIKPDIRKLLRAKYKYKEKTKNGKVVPGQKVSTQLRLFLFLQALSFFFSFTEIYPYQSLVLTYVALSA